MTRSEIKEVIEEAIDEKLNQFWVDRETHYKHHEFIDRWMNWSEDMNKTMWRTVWRAVILFILGLMALGALYKFGGKHT